MRRPFHTREKETKKLDFMVLEYNALRQEILDIRKRIVTMLGMGLMGIPILGTAAFKLELLPVVMANPYITVAFIFMLLFEQKSLMRAGRYIHQHLEPFLTEGRTVGWERFLEMDSKNRRPEELFSFAALLMFSIYYIVGAAKSCLLLTTKLTNPLPFIIVVSIIYTFSFLFVLIVAIDILKVKSKESNDSYSTSSRPIMYNSVDYRPQEVQATNSKRHQAFVSQASSFECTR